MRKTTRNRTLLWVALCAASLLAGCGSGSAPYGTRTTGGAEPTHPPVDRNGRIVSGEEALELYGAAAPPTPGPPKATPQVWFPARAWVEPSILPYDPDETIEFLPMFSTTSLDVGNSLWLGDLEVGKEVVLHGVTEDGMVCLVEGETLQGWTTKGFVACNRLRFTETDAQ
jgi:hypothetical protein